MNTANKFEVKDDDNNSQTSSDDLDSEDESSDDEWVSLDATAEFAADYEGPKSKRRFYQSIRDYSLFREMPTVLDNYMELVV